MHNAVVCALSLYDVIGIMRHLHTKLKSFSPIVQPLHNEAVRDCSFLYIIAKKSVIMSEAFLLTSVYIAKTNDHCFTSRLQCVTVVFPDHTRLLYGNQRFCRSVYLSSLVASLPSLKQPIHFEIAPFDKNSTACKSSRILENEFPTNV